MMEFMKSRYAQFRQACLNKRSLLIFLLGFGIGKVAPFISAAKNPEYTVYVWILISVLVFIWGIGLGTSDPDPGRFCVSVVTSSELFPLPENEINAVTVVDSDPGVIVSSSLDHVLRLWDLNGKFIGSFSRNNITSIHTLIATTSHTNNNNNHIINGLPSLFRQPFSNNHNVLNSNHHQDNTTIISGGVDGSVQLWNVETQQLLHTNSNLHHSTVLALHVVHGYKGTPRTVVISCSSDGIALVWNMDTGDVLETSELKPRIEANDWKVADVDCFYNSEPIVAFGGQNGDCHVLNMYTANKTIFKGHFGCIYGLAIFNGITSKLLISASADWTIRIWNLKTEQHVRSLEGHSGPVEFVQLYYDSNPLIVSGGRDATVRVWDLSTGQLYQTLESDATTLRSLTLSKSHPSQLKQHSNNYRHRRRRRSNPVLPPPNGNTTPTASTNTAATGGSTPTGMTTPTATTISTTIHPLHSNNNSANNLSRSNSASNLLMAPQRLWKRAASTSSSNNNNNNDIDAIIDRPLIFSCESDATIRVWDLDRILRDLKWNRRKHFAFVTASLTRFNYNFNKPNLRALIHNSIANGYFFQRRLLSLYRCDWGWDRAEESKLVVAMRTVFQNEELRSHIASFI